MPDETESEVQETKKCENEDGAEHDPHYEPIVSLPLVKVSTNEENEEEMCKIRARLYRFDIVDHEWKERGTGDIKLLLHPDKCTVRVVMRRDKTLKLCANHFITEEMQLQPHMGSTRAFNWTSLGDFADETSKQEFLAVKFGNVENANLWKTKFNEALEIVKSKSNLNDSSRNASVLSDVSDDSSSITVSDSTADNNSLLSNQEKDESIVTEKLPKKCEDNEVILKLTDLKLEKESPEEVSK